MMVAVHDERGASLLELVVGLAFAALFATMLQQFARSMTYGVRVLEVAVDAEEAARVALHVIARDLRDAGFCADGSLGNGIRSAQLDIIDVVADRNEDGDTDDANEHVRYSFDASTRTLRRATGSAPPQPFLTDLTATGVQLAYFDTNDQRLDVSNSATPARVRRIDVMLQIEMPHPDPTSPVPIRVVQRESVALRNG